MGNTYYTAKVRIESMNDKGQLKKRTEQYLVKGESVTDVEAKVYKDFEGFTDDWEVTSVTETKIVSVIE